MSYLGEHPELQTLIRAQSKDLVKDAVGEIRSHAVHADNALERAVCGCVGERTHDEGAGPGILWRGATSQWSASRVGDTGVGAVTAGFVSRLLAFVIDIFVMALIAVVVIQAVTLTAEFFRLPAIQALRGWLLLASRLIVLVVVGTYLPLSWILRVARRAKPSWGYVSSRYAETS